MHQPSRAPELWISYDPFEEVLRSTCGHVDVDEDIFAQAQ